MRTVLFILLTLLLPVASTAVEPLVLTSLEPGDTACYTDWRDAAGETVTRMAVFTLCERQDLVGRRLEPHLHDGEVLAASCQGDPDCDQTEVVPLVYAVTGAGPPPVFVGEVGDLELARAFDGFAGEHVGEVVDLDLTLVRGAELVDDDDPFFVAWTECSDLEPGEAPSAMKCGGIEVSIRRSAAEPGARVELRGGLVPRVRGRFQVLAYSGPLQGLFAVPLMPVADGERP